MRPRKRKIRTFDGAGFWSGAYAHRRARLLRMAGVPDDEVADLVDVPYMDIPADIRYEIETGGIRREDL